MRFADVCAGLGGFHIALQKLDHKCIFACEIDETLRALYKENFGVEPTGDIRKISVDDVPNLDILCAGFPCQPFSKAGRQHGFDDPDDGDLIVKVLDIIEARGPSYVILENVPEFAHHNGGFWCQWTETELQALGYEARHRRMSPHKFGLPQVRDRLFIVASLGGLKGFDWPKETGEEPNLTEYLEPNPKDAKQLSKRVVRCLDVWQEFVKGFPGDLPSWPIWTMEFGATYPFEKTTPHAVGVEGLRAYQGSHGRPLKDLPDDEVWKALPSHARTPQDEFPEWKKHFIRSSRALYDEHKVWIDAWLPKLLDAELAAPSSWQKLEWNCKGEERDIWRLVIQFRASGVRVKRATTSPSLVAMTDTQVPIIGWQRRYLTPREAAKLQSLGDIKLPGSQGKAFAALGNAINVRLVELIATELLKMPWRPPAYVVQGRRSELPRKGDKGAQFDLWSHAELSSAAATARLPAAIEAIS
jgi:DNA (cytosine-5)-methyltransferase 1